MTKNPITHRNCTNNFDLVQVFCIFDDIIKLLCFEHKPFGGRKPCLTLAEICTIILLQKEFNIANKKALYKYLLVHHIHNFPKLGSYKSFCELMNTATYYLLQIIIFLMHINQTKSGEIVFIDSTKLEVCKIWRSSKHKTMKGLANKSKSTTGWFYGLKLHIMCDEFGNLIQLAFTSANIDDRIILKQFLDKIQDKIIGADAGYCSKECEKQSAWNNNILLSAIRKNMKTIAAKWQQKVLNMRSIVETCFSVMKTRLNLVSTLARSINGYLAHYVRCVFMYIFKDWLRIEI